jgi:putative ABC transport system permease protein
MKLLKYMWRNVTRNKLRSLLTIFSVAFSLALMTVLFGYIAMQDAWGREASKYNRIVVMNSQGFSGLLPISYVDRVRSIEGVEAAVPYSWFGGNYKDEQMPFAQFGTDPNSAFDVWTEFDIDPAQLEEWKRNRRGCVVDRRMADRRGWKIGERIPLKGTYYPFTLDLTLCGIYDTPQPVDSLWFNLAYLDEGLREKHAPGAGNAGMIFARVASADIIAPVSKEIDTRFASSENPTRTQTEQAFAQMFNDMIGGIRAYIRLIAMIVVFSLTLVAANSMAMSMRERTTEVAVLKAIGFSRSRVLALVLGESCWIATVGGVLGVLLGCAGLQALHNFSSQIIPIGITDLAGWWLGLLLVMAIGIGLLSGIAPAVMAAQRPVVDGLRRVV